MTTELENLKLKNDNNMNFEKIDKEILDIKHHINSIEQYLRINNLEIDGLPQPEENESDEDVLIAALNSLDLGYQINFADIDISHPLPSKRRDNKTLSVVKFVSRKTKFDILTAKKQKQISNLGTMKSM